VADTQADEIQRVGTVGFQGPGTQLDLITEHHRDLKGMAGAAEEAQRRGPPCGGALHRIDTSGKCQMLAEHRGPQLRSWWLAERMILRHSEQCSDLHLGDFVTHSTTIDGEISRCENTPGERIISDMNQNNQTTSDPKIEAIQRLYAAYGRGDVDAVLAELADDVDWAAEAASTSVPWYGTYHNKGDVPRFFKEIGSNVEVTEFTLLSLTSNDTDVIVAIHWDYTVNATGKRASMNMQHWWRFADGRIVFFRGSEDTEQSAAAFSA